ncbi:MAG: CaiB/BaiF CoA transferase family protein [Mycobacterium sp.]
MPSPIAPLAGVRVLDLTRFPPGQYCTVLLADLGADVVRLEAPGASGTMAGVGVGLARNKRSVGVDLRHVRGVELLRRLAAWADVVVENNKPGELDQRGFGYSHAAVELPSLIWCSLSGYGQDGPYAQWPGHDFSYVAHSGLLNAINPNLPWHPNTVLSIPIAASMAATGILAALRERDRTGVGCQLDISLTEAATWVMCGADGNPWGIPTTPDRRLYECADGRYVATAAAEPKTWNALVTGLGLDDLADTLFRWPDAAAVVDRIAAVFATRPVHEWVAELGPRAAVVALNQIGEVATDPHAAARGTMVRVGEVDVPASPIRFRDSSGPRPGPDPAPMPSAGQHTAEILAEAGYSPEEIDQLVTDGAVNAPGA